MEQWPEITKNTTLEEVRKIHKRIWDYVIKYGCKPDCPYESRCVLCEYDAEHYGSENHFPECRFCPADWETGAIDPSIASKCFHVGSLYFQWKYNSLIKEKRDLAKKIRDIPFKTDSQK